jgi:hypothetical protein
MSAKGPDSEKGTPWHVMLYRAYTLVPAKAQYEALSSKTVAPWKVYWNDYQFRDGNRLPVPCPDPALNALMPAGNPGKSGPGSKFVAPFCWKWTEFN